MDGVRISCVRHRYKPFSREGEFAMSDEKGARAAMAAMNVAANNPDAALAGAQVLQNDCRMGMRIWMRSLSLAQDDTVWTARRLRRRRTVRRGREVSRWPLEPRPLVV